MSIHLFLAAAAAVAMQGQDPLAPLPTQPAPAKPLMVEVPNAQPASQIRPGPLNHPLHRPQRRSRRTAVPPLATPPQPIVAVRVPRTWPEVFSAIRGSRWAEAQAGIASLPQSILTPVAKAELYTAKGSPVVSLGQIQALLAEAPDLPQAEPAGPPGADPRRRQSPRNISRGGRPHGSAIRPAATRRRPSRASRPPTSFARSSIRWSRPTTPTNAELLLMQTAPYLSYEARAEAGQRVAWSYFAVGRDADARRVADTYRAGATGEWANQSAWVSGLASWRLNDCNAASNSFREVGSRAQQRELAPAGYYWAARAEQACRRPRSVAPLLKAAAGSPESFYGLLARETLGMDKRLPPDVHNGIGRDRSRCPTSAARKSWSASASRGSPRKCSSIRRRSASVQDHHALIEVAKKLDLASRAILARAQRPVWRGRRRRRSLSHAALDAAQRLAHRSRAGVRAHAAGIELPCRRRQPRRRSRPDAGPSDHRQRHGAPQRL